MRQHFIILYIILSFFSSAAFAQVPIEFVENQGQWGDWFAYKAEIKNGEVYLEKNGFRYLLEGETNHMRLDSFHHGQTKVNPLLKFHVYKVSFEGANEPSLTGDKYQSVYYNYFLGKDQSRWKSGIHPCYNVDYHELYNGIDMHVSSEGGSMVYEFNVRPNSDPGKIKMKFEGQQSIKVKNHNIVIQTSVGEVKEMKPYAYQYVNDEKVEVPCQYNLEGNTVTFNLPGGYDESKMLIIDPVVLWSTMTGSTADNWGYTATYDNAGNFYAGGLVNCTAAGTSFPVTPGAFQTTWGGGFGSGGPGDNFAYAADISIMKFNSTGTSRIYATYIGGSQNEHPHSLIVDASDNLVIAGRTVSQNYPVTSSAYQSTNNGDWDLVVTKLNSTGTALLGSTYIGGTGTDCVNFDSSEFAFGELKHNYGDDSRSEVQIDNAGNIYVAACTRSTNFPTTSTAIATTLSGTQDGVVIKLNSTCSSLLWSTYLGGSGYDAAYVLAFDQTQQKLFVAGGTNSINFPVTTGSWQTTYNGDNADGFIARFLNSPPYTLEKATFVGTSGYDQVYGIQLDAADNVFVMGQSLGGLFPVTAGVFSVPNTCQFIMKMDNNLTSDMISTVFGSNTPGSSGFTNISPTAFLVDTCGNVYVSGWGGNLGITGPTTGLCTGMPITSLTAYQPTTVDGRDFYFIVLGSNMTILQYATYFGRACPAPGQEWMGEHVDGGTSRFSKQGIIYQGICANCGGKPIDGGCAVGFPTTTGVWAPTVGSHNCNQGALKIEFNIGPVQTHITAGPSTTGCAPLTVNFYNTTTNGLTFLWDFGDGSPTTTSFTATHTFTAAGTYTVMLTAANSSACFVTDDTAYLVIVVDTQYIKPSFTAKVTDSCGPYVAQFTNTSTTNITSSAPTYNWSFGDGTNYSGATPPTHNYPDTGCYTVTLVMAHPDACKSPDTVQKVVCIKGLRVSLGYTIPDSLCAGVAFSPVGGASNATGITWSYGDGKTGTGNPPAQIYHTGGTYTVTFIATNPGACNLADSVKKVIKILPGPIADFSFSPTLPETNVPTRYTNLSKNAVRYAWDFGDSESSSETNPVHQFRKTGTYKTCLTAYNTYSCPSIICKQVSAEIEPLIGIPTGFSPNGDGANDILYVYGAAIQTMDLKIYNRWGQLVFHTTNQAVGWDGTFNGQPQPMEAYAYVLKADFIDGSSKLLKGNVTLLR